MITSSGLKRGGDVVASLNTVADPTELIRGRQFVGHTLPYPDHLLISINHSF